MHTYVQFYIKTGAKLKCVDAHVHAILDSSKSNPTREFKYMDNNLVQNIQALKSVIDFHHLELDHNHHK